MRRRVLYCSLSTFAGPGVAHGGHMYSRNNVRQMLGDDRLDLRAVVFNLPANEGPTRAYFDKLGVEHRFGPIPVLGRRFLSVHRWPALAKAVAVGTPFETLAWNQPHLDALGERTVAEWGIDCVVVDYLYVLKFWPSLMTNPVRKVIVTCNREADFYAESLAVGARWFRRVTGGIRHRRVAAFERSVYDAFDKVVAIGRPDVPRHLPEARTAVVTPHLEAKPERWSPGPARDLFFVGAIGHYPNRLAIQYLAEKLAPVLEKRVPDATLTVIGAREDDVPREWRRPSIRYLGESTADEVKRRFLTSKLFLCPVKNNFGLKFKIAEALAFGTPFLASPETMLCVPYLDPQPTLPLDDAESAADAVADLLTSGDRLAALAQGIDRRHREFVATQKNVWSDVLFGSSESTT